MTIRIRTVFFIAFWFLALIPIAIYWGVRPLTWVQQQSISPTVEQVRDKFPIHFASMPPSSVQQHLTRLEEEDAEQGMRFNAGDWALREMRYRLLLLFVVWTASGVFVNWLAGAVIRGKRDLED